MKPWLVFVLLFASSIALAQDFSSLEERMSAADFRAAGLDKLSAEELERLNAWLRANVGQAPAADAWAPPGADRIGFRDPDASGVVTSRIDGEFTGWSGRTRFKLQNGQVWQQIDSDATFGGVRLDSPEVRIEPGLFGSWVLSVDGYNSSVRVKRIQ